MVFQKRRRRSVIAAVARFVETLESRQLLHSALDATFSFQPASAPTPTNEIADTGAVYGDRGNGYTYGWQINAADDMRKRNLISNGRLDAFVQLGDATYNAATWELSVPNGEYEVTLTSGDAKYPTDDTNHVIDVEGLRVMNGRTSKAKPFITATQTVTVTDGKLTITPGKGARNAKLNSIHVEAVEPTDSLSSPQVSIATIKPEATEHRATLDDDGFIRVSRSGGDSTTPLDVKLAWSGSANGKDVLQRPTTVTIPADRSFVDVRVAAKNDSDKETTESAVATVATNGSAYTIGSRKSASVSITNANGSVPTAIVSTFAIDAQAVEGTDDDGLIRVYRSGGELNQPLTVSLKWTSTSDLDSSHPSSVTIAANQSWIDLLVSAKADNLDEPAETARLEVVKASSYSVNGNASKAGVALANSVAELPPSVSIAAITATATEGGANGLLRISRVGGDQTKSLVVNLTWSGTAGTSDIVSRPVSVTIPANAASVDLTVATVNDSVVETDESAIATITTSARYTIASGSGSASVVIMDDDGNNTPAARNTLTWTSVASAPDGLSEGQTAVVNNLFYRFGGYRDSTFVASRKVERYNPATNTWESRADMPIGFTHSGTAIVGTKVWFAGAYEEKVGSPGQQNIGTTRVLIYDTVANTWTDGPSLPEARGSGGMELINNKLYFTSGERLSDRADVGTTWMYDLNNTGAGWQTRADLPAPRSHFGTAVINGILYVVGGQTGHDSAGVPLKTVYAYDPVANTWTQKADLPGPISHQAPATFAFENKIYSFGGDNPANVAQSQVTEYDPIAGTSRFLTSLPSARLAGLAGVINGDQFIFTSGYDFQFRSDTWIGTWS